MWAGHEEGVLMVEINLLGWREQKQTYERRMLFLMMAVSVAATILLVSFMHFFIEMRINKENQRVLQMRKALPDEAVQLEISHSMASGSQVENGLSGDGLTLLLGAVTSSLDNGICFRRIARNESGWRLDGQAASLSSVIMMQRSLSKPSYFPSLVIGDLKKSKMQDGFQFVMRESSPSGIHGD